jgi:hypothetical protein
MKMKKFTVLIIASLIFTFCKGPGSGPLVKESFDKKDGTQVMAGQKSTGPVKTEKISANIQPCEGCIKLSDLFSGKKSYEGKVIRITGQVTKFNAGIMGKNWVHIQDGSEFEGEYDLTVTTAGDATVGDTITIEGKIALDKDFGYGYFYKVIMEDGVPAR